MFRMVDEEKKKKITYKQFITFNKNLFPEVEESFLSR
jgi:hypothetical protein